ncbi:hypothetical protein [Acidovorax kalamii]|nr:hypothetical protein [Acidovorax kalamii]MCO5357699.1 hypothetical protein [Acidovorax kalamii]
MYSKLYATGLRGAGMAIGFSAPASGGTPQLPQLLHSPSPPPQPGA